MTDGSNLHFRYARNQANFTAYKSTSNLLREYQPLHCNEYLEIIACIVRTVNIYEKDNMRIYRHETAFLELLHFNLPWNTN